MTDTVAAEESNGQMVWITRLSAMGSKNKRVESSALTPVVEGSDVGKHEVQPVSVGRVLFSVPFPGDRIFSVQPALGLAFIVNTVKSDHSLEEDVKLGVAGRILRHLKQWLEDISDDLLVVLHHAAGLVNIVKTRHLNEPANVGREELVVDNPGCELVPFLQGTAVDRNPPFYHLVFAGFQIRDHLLGDLSQVTTLDVIIGFEEDFTQSRFSNRVVFQIEFVESVE